MCTGWGRLRQIPSLHEVGGETHYTAQEDLNPLIVTTWGEGRTRRVWFFPFLYSKTLLGFICSLAFGSPQKGSNTTLKLDSLQGYRDGSTYAK